MTTDFYVTVLGSGAAIPTFTRHCSAQVVNVRGFRILIDCGEGSQTQLRACHERLQSIAVVCLSHLHGDHFYGLPGLLSTMHICGRKAPLTIIGPEGLPQLMRTIADASGSHIDFPVEYIELRPSDHYEGRLQPLVQCAKCNIYSFPLRHSVPTYGYVIEDVPHGQHAPRRYAYCCDTAPFPLLADSVRRANLLCVESTFANDFAPVAADKLHSTAQQAATLALQADAAQLLLTHFSNRYKDLAPLLDEAQRLFPNTLAATDGQRYGIEHRTVIPLMDAPAASEDA